MRELALFAGAGGGILGGRLLGWRTVCAVEWEPYAASVLVARQNDHSLDPFPIWDDVQTFDGRPWRGLVDVVSGGFPCQDISAAGRGAGISGAKSGMWRHMARIIGEVLPRFVFVENSPLLTNRGLDEVLGALAALGYDAEWCVLGARDAGAPHQRDRIWIRGVLPDASRTRLEGDEPRRSGSQEPLPGGLGGDGDARSAVPDPDRLGVRESMRKGAEAPPESIEPREGGLPDPHGERLERSRRGGAESSRRYGESSGPSRAGHGWTPEPDVGRVAYGVAARVDRLRVLGNGQVPQCAALAWRTLEAQARIAP